MSSAAMKLAMTFTAIDAASSIVMGLEKRILRLGDAGKQVRKDFEDMVSHARAGLKALAAEKYLFDKLKPGVSAAADVQEAMIDVQMTLRKATDDADAFAGKMQLIRDNAYDVQKWAIGGTTDVLKVTNVLLRPIKEMESIVGKSGAVAATMGLATITKENPEMTAHAMTDVAIPFKIRGPQFGELADWMQRIVTSTNTKVLELMEGMKYVAPAAANLGLGYKETITGMGVLAEHGLRGSVAGTGFKDFLVRVTGAYRSGEDWINVLGLKFFDEHGKAKPLIGMINEMREKIAGLPEDQAGKAITDIMGLKGKERKKMLKKYKQWRELAPKLKALSPKEQIEAITKLFGMEGMPAAFAFMDRGIGSYEYVLKNAEESLPLEEKINMRMGGLKASLEGLQGTWESTLANVFNPMLGTLTALAKVGNDAADAVNAFAEANKKVTAGFNIGIGAAAVGIGGYAGYRLLRAGLSGRRLLKGLGSTAAGVAEGKALQMAAGVIPVFVVNMPAAMSPGGNGLPSPSKTPGAGAKPTLFDAFGNPILTGASAGASSAAATGTLSAAMAALGVLTGTGAVVAGTAYTSRAIGEALAKKHAQYYSIDKLSEMKSQQMVMGGGPGSYQVRVIDEELARRLENFKPEVKNDIRLSINIDPAGRVTTQTSDLNTTTHIDLNRGELMGNMSN